MTTTIPITSFTTVQNSWIHDTLEFTPIGIAPNNYVQHTRDARYILQTSDTSIPIEIVDVDYSAIEVYVNGVWIQELASAFGSGVKHLLTATLPAGPKTVELVEVGCSVTGLGGVGSDIQLVPYYAPPRRAILYGTSIESSLLATTEHLGWPQLMRHMVSPDFGFINHSYPGASAFADNSTDAARNAFVASLAPGIDGAVETRFYNMRMVNDYGPQNVANYQAMLVSLYAKLRAAYPAIKVYTMAAFQGTGPLGPGGTNSYGNSFEDYRNAGRAATVAANAAAGVTYCYDIDGAAIGLVGLADVVHPNNAGHATIAAWATSYWFPTISAQQYSCMLALFRSALAANSLLYANPSDGEVLGFFNQISTESIGAAALSPVQQSAIGYAFRGLLSGNSPSTSNPSDANVLDFWSQLGIDAIGAPALSAPRYQMLKAQLRDVVALNYPGAANPSLQDLLGYFAAV